MTHRSKKPRAALGAPAVLKKEVDARQMLKTHIMKQPLFSSVSCVYGDEESTHPTSRGLRPMCSQATRDAEIETIRSTNLLDVRYLCDSQQGGDERDDGDKERVCESRDFKEVLEKVSLIIGTTSDTLTVE
jgi:hypothetical protein